ncbi:MAG: hybrid sensor histidine kinase/response regulator, partial [Myxococcota bacterium]
MADLLALRYGKRRAVAVIATLIAVGASLPYLGLQLKAVATSLQLMGEQNPQGSDLVLLLSICLGAFAAIFGTRTRETTDQRPGIVAAVAFESVIKLVALGAVALYVWFGLEAELPAVIPTLSARGGFGPSFWVTTLLAGFAVICLPRQFHMIAVETDDRRGLARARWVFPVYLALMSLCVAPIAAYGIETLGGAQADGLVLSIPLDHGQNGLALFAFIGGFSAATAMIIVTTYVVGSMFTNEIAVPLLFNLGSKWSEGEMQRLGFVVVLLRRASIFGVVMFAYLYLQLQSGATALASFGLEAFTLIAQLAPSLLVGLYWRRAHANGAIAAMATGATSWLYFVLGPSVLGGSTPHWIHPDGFLGLSGMDLTS